MENKKEFNANEYLQSLTPKQRGDFMCMDLSLRASVAAGRETEVTMEEIEVMMELSQYGDVLRPLKETLYKRYQGADPEKIVPVK